MNSFTRNSVETFLRLALMWATAAQQCCNATKRRTRPSGLSGETSEAPRRRHPNLLLPRDDWVAGVVNSNYGICQDINPFELRREVLPDLAKRMIRDVSRVSCALATLQLRQGFWQVVSSGRAELASGFGSLTRAGRGTRSAPEREARRAHGFQPPLPYGRVMTSKRWPSGSSK